MNKNEYIYLEQFPSHFWVFMWYIYYICGMYTTHLLEALGNAFARELECADNYEGQIRALPGLCTWGYRARTRVARSFKQSPCWLDDKSNGRTTP
jgi:hypothetical protein